jgi:D-arabinose 1-dehydrogenase-like Zn-dependent alcohol dehydrogenase
MQQRDRSTGKMLEFAAVHHIQPVMERFSMNVQGVEQAFKKLEGNMGYRGVIVV